ncbi:hypothetical protein ACN38_g3291, partial [Penicillium nordicum]
PGWAMGFMGRCGGLVMRLLSHVRY